MGRGLSLELSRPDRHRLDELLSGGLQPVRTVLRALALRQMDNGYPTPAVGVSLGLSAKAVWQIAKRYRRAAWIVRCSMALVRARLRRWIRNSDNASIAVACSPPPEGRAR